MEVGNQITMEVGHKIARDGGQIDVEVATVGGQIAVEITEVGRTRCRGRTHDGWCHDCATGGCRD